MYYVSFLQFEYDQLYIKACKFTTYLYHYVRYERNENLIYDLVTVRYLRRASHLK